MRMIMIFESLVYEESLENTQKYFSLKLKNMNIMFLKNLDFLNANKLLDKIENTLINENSFLQKTGFVEIFYLENIMISFKNLAQNKIDLDMNLNSLEVNLCADSFKSFKIFLTNLLKEFKLVKKLLSNQIKPVDNTEDYSKPSIQSTSICIEIDTNKELNTIMNSHYFDQINKKNEIFSDEIEFDYDDSLKNKNEELYKDHQNLTYSITINHLKINLFDGKDFGFDEVSNLNNSSSNLANISNSDINKSTSSKNEQTDAKLEIINDYMSNQKSMKIVNDCRKRIIKRNYENHIEITVKSIESTVKYEK